jgi:hypothetical protein
MSQTDAALIDQLFAVIERVHSKVAELHRSIDSKWRLLPDWVAEKASAAWDSFLSLFTETWDDLCYFFGNLGAPWELFDAADRWSDLVGGPVSRQVQLAEAGSLDVDDNWEGTAADRYRQLLPQQRAALDAIATNFSVGISTALSDVAKAIITFISVMIGSMIAFVVAMITATASTATLLGIPVGILLAIGAVVALNGALLASGLTLKSACAGANTLLQQRLTGLSAYRNGHWPPARTT